MPRHNGTTRKANRAARRRRWERDERRAHLDRPGPDDRPAVLRMSSERINRLLSPRAGHGTTTRAGS